MGNDYLEYLGLSTTVPFKLNKQATDSSPYRILFGQGVKVVHPCNAFAESAGYKSWAHAIEAMRAGKIVQGQAPRVGKTTFDLEMFRSEVTKAGLTAQYFDLGLVAVGLPDRFK